MYDVERHMNVRVAKMLVRIVFVDSTSSAVGVEISVAVRDVGIDVTSALANVFCH